MSTKKSVATYLRALPTFEELDALDIDAREEFLASQLAEDFDSGGDGEYVKKYRRWQRRCTHINRNGERCSEDRLDPRKGTRCARHFDHEEYDPEDFLRSRAIRAKIRIADMLDAATDELERIIASEAVPAAVRLKAVENVMDRSGVSRAREIDITADVSINDGETAADVVRARLEALAPQLTAEEEDDEILEGEILGE